MKWNCSFAPSFHIAYCAIFPLYWLLLLRISNAISQDTHWHTHTQADTPSLYLHLCSLHRMASVAAVPLWPCPFAVLHFQLIASVGEQKSPLFQCAKCAGWTAEREGERRKKVEWEEWQWKHNVEQLLRLKAKRTRCYSKSPSRIYLCALA